jgi:hypothetical protein
MKMISEIKLFNELEAQKIILFDFRPRKVFRESSLYDFSINIPFDEVQDDILDNPQILDDRLLEQYAHSDYLKNCLHKCKRYFLVIIMSDEKINKVDIYKYINQLEDGFQISDEIYKPLKLYQNLLHNKVREIGIYTRGFQLFKQHFPFLLHQGDSLPLLL